MINFFPGYTEKGNNQIMRVRFWWKPWGVGA